MTHGTCRPCTLCYSGTSGIMKGQRTDNKYVCHNQVSPYKVLFNIFYNNITWARNVIYYTKDFVI